VPTSSPSDAVRAPPGSRVSVAADTRTELALAATVDGELHAPPGAEPTPIAPADVVVHDRGRPGWQRAVHDVVADTVAAQRLLVGETFNAPGQWSSFPPHKHDGGDGEPRRRVYYYRFDRPDGSASKGCTNSTARNGRCSSGTAVVGIEQLHPVCGAGYRLTTSGARAGQARGHAPPEDPRTAGCTSTPQRARRPRPGAGPPNLRQSMTDWCPSSG
jgi:5-deoxy-glucuronate isomerase